METIKLIRKYDPCNDAKQWLGRKSISAAFKKCPTVEWLVWAYVHTNDMTDDKHRRRLVLFKAKLSETVKHLIMDKQVLVVLNEAIDYGEGKVDIDFKASIDKLTEVVRFIDPNTMEYYALYSVSAIFGDPSGYYTGNSTCFALALEASRKNGDYAYALYDGTYSKTIRETMDKNVEICRKWLPLEVWDIGKK